MFKQFMNQTFTLKVTDGTDENGKPEVIETKENIACRIVFKNKLIISSNGQQRTSEGSILSSIAAKVGDLVHINNNDYEVISAAPMYDFENNLQGYKIYF